MRRYLTKEQSRHTIGADAAPLLLCLLALLGVLSGCRSQPTQSANPFVAPDRVPPPATRTVAPGTAQPYYPGDPNMPMASPTSSNFSQPPVSSYPPASYPPTSSYPAPQPGAYPPAGTYPPGATTYPPAYPPNAYPANAANPYPPVNNAPAQFAAAAPVSLSSPASISPYNSPYSSEQSVQVATDPQSIRFEPVAPQAIPSAVTTPSGTTPVQEGYVYTPPIATQGFPAAQTIPTQPSIQLASTAPTPATSDGFRPQGSSFSTTGTPGGVSQEDGNLFGFDPSYSWLRGQLQFFPAVGVWGLRYVTIGAPLDQYGGIAVIQNPDVVAGLVAGEYLLLQGTMQTVDAGNGQFMPAFTVTGLQKQQ